MMIEDQKTIVAEITPQGKCGVSIIRVSGLKVPKIIKIIFNRSLKHRYATYVDFLNENFEVLDKGIAIWFNRPNSFTGEDVLEFHGHGNPILVNLLIQRILKISNVRMANPGEFSLRAFLNEKIDLTQAESIIDLINSSSIKALSISMNILKGNVSNKINKILKKINYLHLYLEGILNFPDDINESNNIIISKKINKLLKNFILNLKKILKSSKNSNFYKNGVKILISGPTNSGKSSLFNLLTNKKASIVTDLQGTTRNLIRQSIYLDNFLVEFIDTAGIRKTNNKIEKIGIKLAKKEIKNSNLLIFVIDSSCQSNLELKKYFLFLKKNKVLIPSIVIFNKIDLIKQKPIIKKKKYKKNNFFKIIYISVKKNKGINLLKKYLIKFIKKNTFNSESESYTLIRNRQILAINKSLKSLLNARSICINSNQYDLVVFELKKSIFYLKKIFGKNVSNNILQKIFSKFCIGK